MLNRDARDSDAGGEARRGEMFGRSGREERRVAAWIGASIVVRGDVTSSEDMTIAGQVEGNVAAREHAVVIAPGARIHGDITARAVVVHGAVTGTITADHRAEVGETGTVDGDIVTPRMAVAEGAVLRGQIRVASPSSRRTDKPSGQAAVPAQSSPGAAR
jgi:cytoskeletal protein CcmA (bactofilin family)